MKKLQKLLEKYEPVFTIRWIPKDRLLSSRKLADEQKLTKEISPLFISEFWKVYEELLKKLDDFVLQEENKQKRLK